MTEQLPISIIVCDALMQQFPKISSICNKLEAQFNFQTMTANWYGDEDSILFVELRIETPQSFILQKSIRLQDEVENYSDDVFSCYDNNEEQQKTLACYVSITDSELIMLSQQSKLLAGLFQVKLRKVLNLIADQLKLNSITNVNKNK